MRKGQGRTMHARTKTRGVLIAALATLLALVGAGTASAVVPGGLVTIPGAAGCVINGGTGGCFNAHNLGGAIGGFQPSIAISPDGANVYATGYDGAAYTLVTFARDPATGGLTQLS